MPEEFPGDYELLILHGLSGRCASLDEVGDAIEKRPEDVRREGPVRDAMRRYALQFGSFAEFRDAVDREVARRGGIEALEDERGLGDFNEFMAGWDER
jgi:hypothetical protein